MKFLYLSIVISFLHLKVDAQPTYFKRLNFNYHDSSFYTHPEDSVLHFLAFSESPDGNSFIHIKTNRGSSSVLKIDLSGNILWSIGGGNLGGTSRTWATGLHATPDGGCIIAYNYEYWLGPYGKDSYVVKFDNAGNQVWSTQLPLWTPQPGTHIQETFDIALSPYGYYCLSEDSIYQLDLSGNLIKTFNFSGPGSILGFANGDLFINANSIRSRIDSLGNTRYTISGPIYSHDTTLFTITSDTIHKIDGMTGAFISSTYFPDSTYSSVQILSDYGWLVRNGILKRYDANGILKWSSTFSLAYFGFNFYAEQSDGTLISGGTYRSADFNIFHAIDYSAFICTIDSVGQSVLDSTTQVWPGDANDDGIHEFADVVYVALAQGSSGPQRYDTLTGNDFIIRGGDIATDFPGAFAIGINHKQCDVYSDGIIDSLDIFYTALGGLSYCGQFPPTNCGLIAPWRIRNTTYGSSLGSGLPYFSCLSDRDSAMTGDTVRFYFILGDNGIVIDSIFGLAFFIDFDLQDSFDVGLVLNKEIISSDLGTISDQLVFKMANTTSDFALMTGRKDLQNAYFVQDTIGYVDIQILDSMGGNIDLTMSLRSFKAITAGGFPIDFQFNTRPVHLRSFFTKVSELKEDKIKLYPNPVKDKLILDGLQNAEFEISIYNYEGKECYSGFNNKFSRLTIDTKEFNSGFYIITFRDETGQVSSRKFIKE